MASTMCHNQLNARMFGNHSLRSTQPSTAGLLAPYTPCRGWISCASRSLARHAKQCRAHQLTSAEEVANTTRWQESGNKGSAGQWRWTLNWNDISANIVVGSCPRSPDDVDTLVRKANIDAIICLQSDGCFEALRIDYDRIRQRGVEQGLLMTRIPIWDFNHGDQALMLPEAVRMLAVLVAQGKRVYVHCTAGINRATLTVVGYLTFVQGWELNEAVSFVKSKRPQAHPYIDCWKTAKARLVEGRAEEVMHLAARLHEEKMQKGHKTDHDDIADWLEAEKLLLKDLFQRQVAASLSLTSAMQAVEAARPRNGIQGGNDGDSASTSTMDLQPAAEGNGAYPWPRGSPERPEQSAASSKPVESTSTHTHTPEEPASQPSSSATSPWLLERENTALVPNLLLFYPLSRHNPMMAPREARLEAEITALKAAIAAVTLCTYDALDISPPEPASALDGAGPLPQTSSTAAGCR